MGILRRGGGGWGGTLPNPLRSCPFSETQGLCGCLSICCCCKGPLMGRRFPPGLWGSWDSSQRGWGHSSGSSRCQLQVLLCRILSPTGSFWKPFRATTIKTAQENLGRLGQKFSLLNQVGDYYKNYVIEALRTLGSTAQYLEKIWKLPCWRYECEACFSHN